MKSHVPPASTSTKDSNFLRLNPSPATVLKMLSTSSVTTGTGSATGAARVKVSRRRKENVIARRFNLKNCMVKERRVV